MPPFALWLFSAAACAQPIHLSSPPEGARPRSAYLTITGKTSPSSAIEIFDGERAAAHMESDRDGRFERVLRLQPGRHDLRVRGGECRADVHVETAATLPPYGPAPYELLQTGDVILVHDRNSQEDALYQPVYTHAALYIGPGGDGAPRLLEAVTEDLATPSGPVAAVPIDNSHAWRNGDRVDIYRLAAGLTSGDRTRIVEWGRRTAGLGLPFSTADLGDIYRAWLLWDPKSDRPRDPAEFQRVVDELRDRLQATDSYDCATLVWHAYLDNTEGHIDLANPNRVVWGGATKGVSPRLTAILHPLLILPDSLALSGKLRRVGP